MSHDSILRVDMSQRMTWFFNRPRDGSLTPPGLANLDGVAIYCRSNRCLAWAVKAHRLPPLVGRLLVLESPLTGIVVRHLDDSIDDVAAGAVPRLPDHRRRSSNDRQMLQACSLPADIRCDRCQTRGRVGLQSD